MEGVDMARVLQQEICVLFVYQIVLVSKEKSNNIIIM